MKNLIALLVLFSFVLVPFYTNAGNIDYSKTEIKISGKNYTLIKVKDLLYKNITNKVNQKQTESLKISSYNSFIKTLDKISKEAQKSKKTQNIHLGYMLEDLKTLLNLDLEKITNKTSQTQEIINQEGVKISNNFKIKTSMDRAIKAGLILEKNKITYDKYIGITEKLYKNSNGFIKYDIDLSELINNQENKLIEGVNIEAIKKQRIESSENGKSYLIEVEIRFQVDGMGIEVIETYENGNKFGFGWIGSGYSEVKLWPEFREIKASITKINEKIIGVSFKDDENINQEGVKVSSDLEINTSIGKKIEIGANVSELNRNYHKFYLELLQKYYKGTIAFDLAPTEIIDREENKLIEGVNVEAIKKQRIESSENGKSKLIKVVINFTIDGMGIEVIETYENGNKFGFGRTGSGYSEVKIWPEFREIKASITRINEKIIGVSYKDDENINQEGVKISSDFKINTSFDKKIKDGIIKKEHQETYNKYYKIAEKLYNKSNLNIKYDIDLSELINNTENKLVNSIDSEEIINQRKFSSENGKATLTKVNISFTVDGMGIEIIEYYSNGNNVGFGYAGMGLTDVKLRIEKYGEHKAGITQINGYIKGQSFGLDAPFDKFYYKTAK